MADTSKKQTFLHGAALLAIATAVVKVIGALYKLPLQEVIGKEGYAYFTTAYDIYTVLLLISTAGLPVAMSRMISQASTQGNYNQVRRIYKVSRVIFLALGVLSTVIMAIGCKALANSMNQPNAWFAIICLAPCALFMGLISTYRGFFQGQGNMRPTSNSQMIEAVLKLVIGLAAAIFIMYLTDDIALAAGGAILGVTVGCAVSVIYLRAKQGSEIQQMPQTGEPVSSFGNTAKQLLSIAVPITIGTAGLQLLTVLETGLYMDRLVEIIGKGEYGAWAVDIIRADPKLEVGTTAAEVSQRAATHMKGIYDMAKTIYNMPCAFIIPITVSVIPAITSHLTLKNDQGVRSTEESAARITGLLSMPCAVGLSVLSVPIMSLLAGCKAEELTLGGGLMAIMGINVFFYAMIQYTAAVMQAHGKAHIPVIHTLICGAARLAFVYILSDNPRIGIMAAPLGTALCFLSIGTLNLFAIRRMVPQKPALLRNLLRPLLSAAVMGVAVYGTYRALTHFLSAASRMHAVILCGLPIVVGVVVYFVCVILFKVIKKEDCLLLPKGDKIAKLLHL